MKLEIQNTAPKECIKSMYWNGRFDPCLKSPTKEEQDMKNIKVKRSKRMSSKEYDRKCLEIMLNMILTDAEQNIRLKELTNQFIASYYNTADEIDSDAYMQFEANGYEGLDEDYINAANWKRKQEKELKPAA